MAAANLLAFDTTAAACSVALRAGEDTVGHARRAMTRGHAEALVPMVTGVMKEAGWDFSDLDGVAVTVGPGAFTGIRIGLAAARGIGLAAACPVIGVTTLEALAEGARRQAAGHPLLCLLDTKRGSFYGQLFAADLQPLTEPEIMDPPRLISLIETHRPKIVCDREDLAAAALDGAAPPLHLGPDLDGPDAADVAAVGAARLGAALEAGASLAPPDPLYLSPPAAVRPKHGGRLRR